MMLSPEGQEKLAQILQQLEGMNLKQQQDLSALARMIPGTIQYPEFPDTFEDNLNHSNIQN